MAVFLTLVRREVGSYFASITGYIVIASVLLLLGLGFTQMVYRLNATATAAPLTEEFFISFYFWIILLLTFPIITMRSFALEKFAGTYEALMTAPVKDMEVVLGKFFGAMIFYLLTWLPLLGFLFILRRYSNDPAALDAGVAATTFLGVLMIGAVYVSMGCFTSALTRNEIVAAILSYAFGLALFLLALWPLSGVPPGWVGAVLNHMSMTEHMEDFARGIIDTRQVIFYVSLTVLFLFLTLKVVESRRWK